MGQGEEPFPQIHILLKLYPVRCMTMQIKMVRGFLNLMHFVANDTLSKSNHIQLKMTLLVLSNKVELMASDIICR